MPLRMRLAPIGATRSQIYNIVVIAQKTKRNAKPVEVIGTYDPIAKGLQGIASESEQKSSKGVGVKFINLDVEKAKKWISHGVQPSTSVRKLLEKFDITNKKAEKNPQSDAEAKEQLSQQREKMVEAMKVIAQRRNINLGDCEGYRLIRKVLCAKQITKKQILRVIRQEERRKPRLEQDIETGKEEVK